jgi:hypothetical protein
MERLPWTPANLPLQNGRLYFPHHDSQRMQWRIRSGSSLSVHRDEKGSFMRSIASVSGLLALLVCAACNGGPDEEDLDQAASTDDESLGQEVSAEVFGCGDYYSGSGRKYIVGDKSPTGCIALSSGCTGDDIRWDCGALEQD